MESQVVSSRHCLKWISLTTEDNSVESVVPFHLFIGSGDWTQVVKLASPSDIWLCLLSQLAGSNHEAQS